MSLQLQVFCLVLFMQCNVWNQPLVYRTGEQPNEPNAIHTILIKTVPKNVFAADEEIPQDAGTWASGEYGLEVYGVNGINEMRVLLPEEYQVDPVAGADSPGEKIVTVRLNDRDITTEFVITILKAGEKYYTIEPYTDRETGGRVIASPSVIIDSQFDEAGEAGVSIIVSPADGFTFKAGSLQYSLADPNTGSFSGESLSKSTNGKYKDKYVFKKSFFQEAGEVKDAIYLYAKFDLAKGVVKVNDVYYLTLAGALAAASSECTVTLLTGFTLDETLTIPAGRKITLESDDSTAKKISGSITIADGGTLKLVSGAGDLLIEGKIEVNGGGGLELSGAVSVSEVNLKSDAAITVAGLLSLSGGISVTRISGKSEGGVVLRGSDLTKDDCDRFIVEGYAIKLSEAATKGVLVEGLASRWESGVERYYGAIQDAVTASSGTSTNPDKITILKDIPEFNAVVEINNDKHVKLVPRFGSNVTLTRADSFNNGSLFTVNSGGSLVLEGNGLKRLVINGNGIGVSSPLINVSGGSLTINTGAELQNNKNTNYGGGYGGGVHVTSGLFTMKGGTISGNTANNDGAGVYVTFGGTFTMSGGTISGNTATTGGGVYVTGINSKFTMSGGTISGNKMNGGNTGTGGAGAGVYIKITDSSFEMNGGTISDNGIAGTGRGGGVCVDAGNFTMSGGMISGNQAWDGGGVDFRSSGTFTMTGGSIEQNKANPLEPGDGRSGGVYIYAGSFTMSGGTISGNMANGDRGSGVYVKNTFTISGSATVDQNNNVYLKSGKWITVGSLGDDSGLVAKITPEKKEENTKVLEGVNLTTIERFTLSDGIEMVIELSGTDGLLKPAIRAFRRRTGV